MSILTILLFIPLIAVGTIVLFRADKNAPYRISLMASIMLLLGVLYLFVAYPKAPAFDGFKFRQVTPWVDQMGLSYSVGVDGINLVMLLLTAIVAVAAIGVSSGIKDRAKEYFICINFIITGAIGAFISLDLFFLYIFHEFALIPTFILIGLWGQSIDREKVAMKLTIYLSLGSLILLAGVLAFFFALPEGQQTFDLIKIRSLLYDPGYISANVQTYIYPLMLIGFGILISLFPFHSWAPQGYAGAPAAAAMLHAGVLKKFGLYGLIRVAEPLLPAGAQGWSVVLGVLLCANIFYVGYVAVAERNLRMMLGFSSVSHMGYIFLGILAGNTLGISGAVLYIFGHGLTAAIGFGLAGYIHAQIGHTEMNHLGGLMKKMPFVAVIFMMAALASVGVPGFANFAGEILIFFGAWSAGWVWFTVIALWGVIISSIYMMRAIKNIFYGNLSAKHEHVKDLTGTQRWPYLLLTASLLIVGFAPQLLLQYVGPSVDYWFKFAEVMPK
ncbi:MAG: NADH-quinone oxidoreductase subunit M [Verrucomicrobiota bacterium]|nr:NADH-quinone oxidoreductase subunit M [Verrucomicrobiota bacterium]